MNLSQIQEMVFKEYVENGYLAEWTEATEKAQKKSDIAEVGLITSEIGEATDEIRSKQTNADELALECADIIIRTLNFMSRKGFDAEHWILEKDKKNRTRGKLHGRSV